MKSAPEHAARLLRELRIADHPAEHAFYLHVADLERRSVRARWIYPAVYVVLGAVFLLVFSYAGPAKQVDAGKFLGAVLGVFSALLVFWKPRVTLEQDDCARLLNERKLPSADLNEINRALELPARRHDEILKLAAAVSSFFATYLLLR